MEQKHPFWERASWVAGVVAAVIAMVVLIGDDDGGDDAPASGSSPPPVAPSPEPDAYPPTESDEAPTEVSREPIPITRYLVQEDYVGGEAYWSEESASIGGSEYPNSITFPVEADGSWLDYNLGGKCHIFEATIGISDETEDISNPALAEISLDGEPAVRQRLEFGVPVTVSLDTSGKLRLRISSLQIRDPSMQEIVVFGDARLRCLEPMVEADE